MAGSLLGKPADEVRAWSARYLAQRRLTGISVDALLQAAALQSGVYSGPTKTKLRRAATWLKRQVPSAVEEEPAAA